VRTTGEPPSTNGDPSRSSEGNSTPLTASCPPCRSPFAGSFGVDTVGLTVPLVPGSFLVGQRLRLDGVGTVTPGNDRLYVEASLPRRDRGHNLGLLTAEETVTTSAGIITELQDAYPLRHTEVGQFQISRLDVACNIDALVGLDRYLDCVVRRQPSHFRPRLYFTDGRATSFVAGVRAWSVSVYDKHVESGAQEAIGLMRVEVRLRRRTLRTAKWLAGANMLNLEDLTDESLARAFERAVERASLTDRVAHPSWPGLELRIDWEDRSLVVERDSAIQVHRI
jgi:hypothetical protein